ncbi:MAG: hypothetical protein A2Z18_10110 [Armatimonadetes bacterium RBG_16_58_9]|nr:MAG: hypothetical protein A2Z18_10110 [Armatimonadetes bacterium RBG_16_58_9]
MQLDEFVRDVARGAGKIVKEKFHAPKTVRSKSAPGDVVTEVDEESERYIVERIRSEYPNDCILSEECGSIGGVCCENMWIIDPIDGTRNYATQVPFFCVSIGLAHNGKAEMGAIFDPIHDEMFFAQRGAGAYLNGGRIEVSEQDSFEDAIISVSWVKRRTDRAKFLRYIEELSHDTSYFRRFGSAALVMSYLASGRVHAYIQGGLNPWDVAAGIVLIEEAGGTVTDFAGNPIDLQNADIEIATANPKLHSFLLDRVIRSGMG